MSTVTKKSGCQLVLVFLRVHDLAPESMDAANSHKRFSNNDVIEMVKLGLSDDVIIAKIHTASAAGAEVLQL